jgi:hypothetical protein
MAIDRISLVQRNNIQNDRAEKRKNHLRLPPINMIRRVAAKRVRCRITEVSGPLGVGIQGTGINPCTDKTDTGPQ